MPGDDESSVSNASNNSAAYKKNNRDSVALVAATVSTKAVATAEASRSIGSGVKKGKQTKSRNGCHTCKAKRLKCDEQRPSCANCEKRNVICGGYKRDFKWKVFAEPNTGSPLKSLTPPALNEGLPEWISKASVAQVTQTSLGGDQMPLVPTHYTISPLTAHVPEHRSHGLDQPSSMMLDAASGQPIHFDQFPRHQTYQSRNFAPELLQHEVQGFTQSASYSADSLSPLPVSCRNVSIDQDCFHDADDAKSTIPSPQSSLVEMAMSHSDLHGNILPARGPAHMLTSQNHQIHSTRSSEADFYPLSGNQTTRPHQLHEFSHSSLQPEADEQYPFDCKLNSHISLAQQPLVSSEISETSMPLLDHDVLGIVPAHMNPNENPWRNLIWPIAHHNPVIFEAIASMACFQNAPNTPNFGIHGAEHTQNGEQDISQYFATTSIEVALAIALAVALSCAFTDTCEQAMPNGWNHIKAAKQLVRYALAENHTLLKCGDELRRLHFLCRTWVYLDVLSRLTYFEDDVSTDFDAVVSSISESSRLEIEIDPLMGSATTMFPMIGHVANLVRRTCRDDRDLSQLIPQAVQLKTDLESWTPPTYCKDCQDPTLTIKDSLYTAEAYRWATLLCLHQAVPELSTSSSSELAKKARGALASVSPMSRATMVHTYPLLAAGCEADNLRDREWVRARWRNLLQHMPIGNAEKCAQVTEEVWKRRDAHFGLDVGGAKLESGNDHQFQAMKLSELEQWVESLEHDGLSPALSSGSRSMRVEAVENSKTVVPPPENASAKISYYDSWTTVKSSLHWLGVMRDWKWKVFLG